MKIEEQIKNQGGGSICMFGAWFGKPMDNFHQPTYAEYEAGVLEVGFNEDEVLEIGNPSCIERDGRSLIIGKADWVKWTWYSYGLPKTEENKYFYLYEINSGKLTSETNSPWPSKPNINEPAFVIC